MRVWIVGVAAAMSYATAVAAHHSLAAIYDRNASTTLEGTVSEFRFVNPHPFLTLTVERDRRLQTWKLELDNRFELEAIGITAATFQRGHRLVVTGSTARDGSRSVYALRIERPADGFWYEQVGSTPRTGRRR